MDLMRVDKWGVVGVLKRQRWILLLDNGYRHRSQSPPITAQREGVM
jgi:hypothetical protein